MSVIGGENTIVGPWELVEFAKDLSIVPPAMNGPLSQEIESEFAMRLAHAEYVKLVRAVEQGRQLDSKVSTLLCDEQVQALVHAFWLVR